MIVLSFLIVLFGTCGFVIGNSLISRLAPAPCFESSTDKAFLSTWLGALILANTFLAVSLCSPLTSTIAIAITLSLAILSLLSQKDRESIKKFAGGISVGPITCVIALTLGVAAYCSQVIVWYDTRLYHMQAIKWLSEYGLVPGQALIHERFGYISSWFAPAAAFNHGVLQGRIAPLTGGFCLLMLLAHLLVAFFRTIRRQARDSDRFIVLAYLPALAVIMLYGMPNSPSPDLPVIILVIEVAWCMMLVSDFQLINPGQFDTPINAGLIPLLLGAGAASVKLSAFPLLAVSGCYYLFSGRLSLGKLAVSGSTLSFFLVPFAAAGLVTTGCAFYPSPLFCMDVPWSLGAAQAAAESTLIRDWARWGGIITPSGATSWNWIVPWLAQEKVCTFLLALSALAAPAIMMRRAKGKSAASYPYVVALAASGIAFMFYAAPTWRFGLGYLVLLPALVVTSQTRGIMRHSEESGVTTAPLSWAVAGVSGAILLATHIYLVPRPTFRALEQFAALNPLATADDRPHFNLLLPPRLWNVEFAADAATGRKTAAIETALLKNSVLDVVYYHPEPDKSELCGEAPLPCSPVYLHGMRLRDHGKGIAGGFVRSKHPAPH